jgi:threonine/homoserine/homoserine lactone efflux protein
MIEFVIAVFFLLITPGPGVLTTAGIGAAFGFRAGFAFVAGLCLGGFITMMMVIAGLGAVVLAVPSLRVVLLVASVGYLIYLAVRIASAGAKIGFSPAKSPLGFTNGLLLQFINPKAYVVATTLFSGFAFMPGAPAWEITTKLLLFNAVWLPVHFIWLGFGTTLGALNLSNGVQRVINMAMAASMLIVVGVALLSLR